MRTALSLQEAALDRFRETIPWSFVLHDEPWNLIPTFRDVNSSKSDKLPNLEKLLDSFCLQQFDALMTIYPQYTATKRHKGLIQSYLAIDSDIPQYQRNSASIRHFSQTLRQTISPMHQIAFNQGFPVWSCPIEYHLMTF